MDVTRIHKNSYPKACSATPNKVFFDSFFRPIGERCNNRATYKIAWKGCPECRLSNIPSPIPTDPYLLSIFRTDVDELKGHPACGRKEYICQDCVNNDKMYTVVAKLSSYPVS